MRDYGKKGAEPPSLPTGANAAILVMVIAAFIILYILFLPKGERDKLLERDISAAKAISPEAIAGAVLIKENPGVLTKLREKEFEHRIPSFNLFTKKEDAILKSFDSINVETSRSVQRKRSVVLAVKDKVENAKLSFSVNDHSGVLIVAQDETEIFRGEVDAFTDPLSLELKEENLFEFSTEPVPWYKPFSKNFYDLRDVKITGTVEKVDNKEARHTVILGQEEFNLISEASLSYFVECSLKDVGVLSVYVNEKLLASKVPDCGNPERLQLDPKDLLAGKNDFRFVAEKGTYLLDQAVLRTKLKEPIFPIYFFSINSSVFKRIENNSINSTLSITFVDDLERKTATVEINNQKTRLDTRAANYSKNVDSFLIAGTNFLRLVPETTLSIIELRLVLDCRRASECS